jgi:hypothetical protein
MVKNERRRCTRVPQVTEWFRYGTKNTPSMFFRLKMDKITDGPFLIFCSEEF